MISNQPSSSAVTTGPPVLRLDVVGTQRKAFVRSFPFRISSNPQNQLVFEPDEGILVGTVVQTKEPLGFQFVAAEPFKVDAVTHNHEAKLTHGCKIILPGKYNYQQAGNIITVVFSKQVLSELNHDGSTTSSLQKRTIFQPSNQQGFKQGFVSMEQRLITQKLNFEEREQLK